MVRSLTAAFVAALAVASFASATCDADNSKRGTSHHKSSHHRSKHHKGHHQKQQQHKSSSSSSPSNAYKAAPTKAERNPASSPSSNSYSNGPSGPSSSGWKLSKSVSGQSFLDYWKFETEYSGNGGQGGIAQYTDLQTAQGKGMVGINAGITYLGVDTGDSSGSRNSIRVSSNDIYNAGTLWVVDVQHMPSGCGVWPALWTVAQDGDWPGKGELDLIEGVNGFSSNALSAHTKSGFDMKTSGFSAEFMLTTDQKTNCDADATDDQGCGLRDPDLTSFGDAFNNKQGGVWVLEWTDDHVAMYLFDRDNLPSDIASKSPQPGSGAWGTPRAVFAGSSGQKTSDFFQDHVLVANTNLCGKWVDSVWGSVNTQVGQDQSCAASTGFSSCEEYVKSAGDKFKDAYWAFNHIDVYTQ